MKSLGSTVENNVNKLTKKEVEVFCLLNIKSNNQTISDHDMSVGYFSHEYVLLAKGTVVLTPAEEDPIPRIVETLKESIQKERADSELRVEAINAQISSVLALENNSGEES